MWVQARAISHLGTQLDHQASTEECTKLVQLFYCSLFCCSRDCAHQVRQKLLNLVPLKVAATIKLVCLYVRKVCILNICNIPTDHLPLIDA